jgi:hypothetical protein
MTESTLDEQRRLVRALAAALARGAEPVHHIETHISHVLLAGGHAYKIKKALANPFLDQSTLARRRAACAAELRLNRRLAPGLYLDVVPITGTHDAPSIDGDGPLLEVAVKMRAFDEDGLWDRLAARGELGAADIDELAAVLARFHAGTAVAGRDGPFGTPAQVRPLLLDSLRDLGAAPPGPTEAALLAALRTWESETFPRLAPLMAQRLADGRVREGHGDLHLGNVAREAGHCLVFDGVEFNDAFRWLDVMSEVAFMAMDLHAHARPALAHRFVDAYLQHSADYDGLRVFDYYRVHRALVRAKVARLRADQVGATAAAERDAALAAVHDYLRLALRFAMPRRRALLVTHGLSGSGKTTLTQGLLEQIGALRIRADVERKRLAGLAPLQASHSAPGAGLYGAAMTEATYARLFDAARAVIEGGWSAILDATFLRRADRDTARRLAGELGVPCVILHFDAAPAELRERVRRRAARASDASEADEAVLARQLQTQEPLAADEVSTVHAVRTLPPVRPGAVPGADWSDLVARLGLAPPGA